MTYSYTIKSPFGFSETLDELRIAFAEKGFGVVSNVDIAERVRKKIDPSFGEYTNLGFCNPMLAHKYLEEDMNLGIFMPCTVSVYEKDDEVIISAGLPDVVISKVIKNDSLDDFHKEISYSMRNIINNI